MKSVALAVGEVPWESALLDAIADHPQVEVTRRFVDVTSLVHATQRGEAPAVVIMSPALRGFAEKPVRAMTDALRVIVLLDTVRPPWLEHGGTDVREFSTLAISNLVEELAQYAPDRVLPEQRDEATGQITVFAGVAGGVGVSSLAWSFAKTLPNCLLIDGNDRQPSLGFLGGAHATSATLLDALRALQHNVAAPMQPYAATGLTLPLEGAEGLNERDVDVLLSVAAASFEHVVVDAGVVPGTGFSSAMMQRADRLLLVTTPAPSGVLRLPGAIRDTGVTSERLAVVVNRMRESAVGTKHARSALRGLIERSCGALPLFIDEDVERFDMAWIAGDPQPLRELVQVLAV